MHFQLGEFRFAVASFLFALSFLYSKVTLRLQVGFAMACCFFNREFESAMTLLSDIYNGRILELAGNISHSERLSNPDASARAHSKLCGSTIEVDLKMSNGRVTEYGQVVKACLLGQSAAAIMGLNIIGSTASELRLVRDEMARMLKENGPPPQGKWSDLELLEPVREFKARHTSTLLVFDAVLDAVSQIEARDGDIANSTPEIASPQV